MKNIIILLAIPVLVLVSFFPMTGCGAAAQVPSTITLDAETVACVSKCLDQGITNTGDILAACPTIPDALLADLELFINAVALKKGVVRKIAADAGAP